jgi:hypothetical protein
VGQRLTSDVDDIEEVGPRNPLAVKTVGGANPSVVSAFAQETVSVGTAVSMLTQAIFSGAVRATLAIETVSMRFRIDGGPPSPTVEVLVNPDDVIVLPNQAMMENFQAIATAAQPATIWAIYESGLPGATGLQIIRGQGTDDQGNTYANLNTLIAGEDQSNGLVRVERPLQFVATATAHPLGTVLTSVPGVLHSVTIQDNTSSSPTDILPAFTLPASTVFPLPTIILDVQFTAGLKLTTTHSTVICLAYR